MARVRSGRATPAPPATGAARITIDLPLDIYLVNLQIVQETIEPYEVTVGKEKKTLRRKVRKVVETVTSGQTEQTIRSSIERANEIWKPFGISIRLAKLISRDVEFDSKVVSEDGFLVLVPLLSPPPRIRNRATSWRTSWDIFWAWRIWSTWITRCRTATT